VDDEIYAGVGNLTSYSEVVVPHIRNLGLLWPNLTQRVSVKNWPPTTSMGAFYRLWPLLLDVPLTLLLQEKAESGKLQTLALAGHQWEGQGTLMM